MKRTYSHSSTPLAPRLAKTNTTPLLQPSPQSQQDTSAVSAHSLKQGSRKSAWELHRQHLQVGYIQPFRRRRRRNSRDPPKCVPPLDLSQFNQPDELMDPVEILARPSSGSCSVRSQTSWGQHYSSDKLNIKDPVSSVVTPMSSHNAAMELPSQDAGLAGDIHKSHLDLMEAKMVSNERELPFLDCEDNEARVKIPHASLHKRFRFEACIATQNGRDIHRELCGFYFLSDSSMTIYEFRQFGKKSNALPLIQRGVYEHCSGINKGKPYEINFLTKGALLQFECQSHPGLPQSFATKALVSIRVVEVDEQRKRRLLSEGLNPVQCRQVERYLSCPAMLISHPEENLLQTLQGMVRNRLSGRASKTLVMLGRDLRANADQEVVSFLQLQQSLRKFHISLTEEDMQQFWHLLSKHGLYFEDSKGIQLDFCLSALTGRFSEDRASCVRQIFKRLDSCKSGCVQVEQMHKYFIDANATEDSTPWSDMFLIFNLKSCQASISYSDFENFHLGLSIETSLDSKFINLMRTFWRI